MVTGYQPGGTPDSRVMGGAQRPEGRGEASAAFLCFIRSSKRRLPAPSPAQCSQAATSLPPT